MFSAGRPHLAHVAAAVPADPFSPGRMHDAQPCRGGPDCERSAGAICVTFWVHEPARFCPISSGVSDMIFGAGFVVCRRPCCDQRERAQIPTAFLVRAPCCATVRPKSHVFARRHCTGVDTRCHDCRALCVHAVRSCRCRAPQQSPRSVPLCAHGDLFAVGEVAVSGHRCGAPFVRALYRFGPRQRSRLRRRFRRRCVPCLSSA